jgi:hypothetical protein
MHPTVRDGASPVQTLRLSQDQVVSDSPVSDSFGVLAANLIERIEALLLTPASICEDRERRDAR